MKRTVSVIVILAMIISMLSVFSVSATTDVGEFLYINDYAPVNKSFDTVYANGEYGADATVYVDGGAGAWLTANLGAEHNVDNKGGDIKTLGMRGWIGFDQEIEAVGFAVGPNVYFGNFFEATGEDVKNAGGQYATRFNVRIPVLAFPGETEFVIAFRLADGKIVEFTTVDDLFTKVKFQNPDNIEIIEGATTVSAKAYEGTENHVFMSYDTNFWNGAQLNAGYGGGGVEDPGLPYWTVRQYTESDGTLDSTKYSGLTYGVHGWASFSQDVIAGGFLVGDTVYLNSYANIWLAEEGVVNHIVANCGRSEDLAKKSVRFIIHIPLCLIDGTEKISAAVKLADGTIVLLDKESDITDTSVVVKNVENGFLTYEVPDDDDEPGEEPNQPTGDATVALFAVILVAAMGAAVVLSKKRAF